ncbi:group III truncated hemoglobin [Hahella sp. CR1]|uniref:group III truncated hemoglobin n=1 Tax=Hahella sp. CR1 TaxID=2992807 RepID=UPI0024428481|nr:group III truncated hemoglobin [Hahella sp. CR1]MDG9671280.1 group III truncated hemoglobin [Hahella sp. CR1]
MTVQPAQDIASVDDIQDIIERFYALLLNDEQVGFFFTEVAAIDLPAHLPRIVAFWNSLLFGVRAGFQGRVYEDHAALDAKSPLRPEHFARWLTLWRQEIDRHHAGPRAELMKTRAAAIADSMSKAFETARNSTPGDDANFYSAL